LARNIYYGSLASTTHTLKTSFERIPGYQKTNPNPNTLEIDSCLDLSHALKIAGSRPKLRQKSRSPGCAKVPNTLT
jgi:hypothetical protein